MKLTFRETTPADASSMVQPIIKSEKSPPKEALTNEALLERTQYWIRYLEGTHTPRFGKPPRVAYLAFEGEVPVGSVACHHSSKQGCESELQSMHVHYRYQGKGIGATLLSLVVDWLVGTDIKSMMVNIHSDNPYQQFYQKYGGVRAASSRYEWHDLDALQERLRAVRVKSD